MRKIGYMRVSTDDQNMDLQKDALEKEGCEIIFSDKISGAKTERPGLDQCRAELHPGDTLLVWRIDRLGRSMQHLVAIIEDLRQAQINFRSIQDGVIDTTTASGELVFNIFASMAQFERRLIQERTRAGLAASRSRGLTGGRPKTSAEDPKVKMAKQLHANKEIPIGQALEMLDISRATFYKYVKM